MKKITILLLAMTILLAWGCDNKNDSGVSYVKSKDIQIPVDENGYTSEQRNIIQRNKIAQDPNQIMWIYCLSDNGQVVFYGPVKGKVTSSGKHVQSFSNIGDGTSGESDNYIYWFDPSGKYFQWNRTYFLSTFEIKIQTPVLNTRRIR